MVILLIFLSGCSIQELNQRIIVASVGIDKTEDNKIRLTMGLIDPRAVELKDPLGVRVYSFEGETIFDANRRSITETGKHPMWPYIKIIIFGPSVSKEDIVPCLDFFNRNNEVQPNPFIVFSEDPAEDIVHTAVDFGNIPAVIMEQQLKHQIFVSYEPSIILHQFTEMMLTPERKGFAPIIKKYQKEDKNIPTMQGLAIIKGAKWIGKFNSKETRGLLWVREEVEGGILSIPALNGNGKIGLEILKKAKVEMTPKITGAGIQINLRVKSAVNIVEMMDQTDIHEKNLSRIKLLAEKAVKKEIQSAIDRAKDMQVDIFGFDEAVHRKNPRYWKTHQKDWDRNFSSLPIQINVNLDLQNIGLNQY